MKKQIFRRFAAIVLGLAALVSLAGCLEPAQSSDQRANAMQENLLQDAVSQTGMPAIKNFRERKTLKMIYELRDQEDLGTYTYLKFANGSLQLLCPSIGFAISEATGYTSPDKVVVNNGASFGTVIQAEPNGLFTPDTSTATYIVCVDPDGKPAPVQLQGDYVTSPFKLAL